MQKMIRLRVHAYYRQGGRNCATTSLKIFAEFIAEKTEKDEVL
ncbi:MAG: hypothetical protein ABFC84_03220 [Veillonellales bacterium]